MTDKRPRIPADLAERIQALYPHVPFERAVRIALQDQVEEVERMREMSPADVLREDWIGEIFQTDLKAFDAAVKEARDYWVAELNEQAFEDEHTDEDGNMDQAAFERFYPTDDDKRRYFKRQGFNPRDYGYDFDLD